MKIPTPIGKTISKSEIIICPDCEGEGVIFGHPQREEKTPYIICLTCNGKRVLIKQTKIIYNQINN